MVTDGSVAILAKAKKKQWFNIHHLAFITS